MRNIFFKINKNIKINDILKYLKLKKSKINFKIDDIKDLGAATSKDITFFHSKRYLSAIKNTKAKFVLTHKKFKNILPKNVTPIEVNDVLLSVAKVTSLFYPDSLNDTFDENVSKIDKKMFVGLKIGQNVLVGKNIKIGKNCCIGHNTIIEQNVVIGDN